MDNTASGVMFPIENSHLYEIWIQEKMHIMRNKWFLSEKAGFDVGMTYAKFNWDMIHRKKWLDGLRASGQYPIS